MNQSACKAIVLNGDTKDDTLLHVNKYSANMLLCLICILSIQTNCLKILLNIYIVLLK